MLEGISDSRKSGSTGPGRPPHQPTEKDRMLVTLLKAQGAKEDFIARKIGVCLNTLKQHYREELDFGKEEVDAKVGASLITAAMNPQHPKWFSAAVWYSRSRMGWGGAREADPPGWRDGLPPEGESDGAVVVTLHMGERRVRD
ncbi:hypothetical protein [Rubellimicrobium sp. CFH 75288]|uniref:hypothetical protein n=1 Tax=Rubellimicrobium sp. CFH 75288 TaxID=2697034 RepID=UPI001411EED4|nr:hypothetical protein [Rubellimicrobium sp. CFH 75288]NAZ37164.1 hypothetical protein [Rubellimicrobium sp. CFH 75288]